MPKIKPIALMVSELSQLPGIGPKTAQRLAYHILSLPQERVYALATALYSGKKAVRACVRCGDYAEGELCELCADTRRDDGVVCVVRDPRDVAAMERMRDYRGRYHVLSGVLSPVEGIGPDQLRIRELMERLKNEPIREVILATNPDVEGEATAAYLARLIKPTGVKVTRIAHGVPIGGDLEYADEMTLLRAMQGRREI